MSSKKPDTRDYQKALKQKVYRLLGTEDNTYKPDLVDVAGSMTGGVLLSYLYRWFALGRDTDGWIYKTREEITQATGMTRHEQKTARRNLVELGVLKEDLRGMPARMHFWIDSERIMELLGLGESGPSETPVDSPKTPPLQLVEGAGLTEPPCDNVATGGMEVVQTQLCATTWQTCLPQHGKHDCHNMANTTAKDNSTKPTSKRTTDTTGTAPSEEVLTPSQFIALYNEYAAANGWRKCLEAAGTRLTNITGTLKRHPLKAEWIAMFERSAQSPWIMGKVPPKDGDDPFKASIDFFTRAVTPAKIQEGLYDPRGGVKTEKPAVVDVHALKWGIYNDLTQAAALICENAELTGARAIIRMFSETLINLPWDSHPSLLSEMFETEETRFYTALLGALPDSERMDIVLEGGDFKVALRNRFHIGTINLRNTRP